MAASRLRTTLWEAVRGPRKSFDELRDAVYLDVGDVSARIGRFSILLVLSAVVATAGVLADSTATVIGAMIIAPLATPIYGIAAAIVGGEPARLTHSLGILLAGMAATVLIGAGLALALPEVIPLAENSQVIGRTSPTIIDLLAAAATGLAGALGIARRDVSDILPGVAIAISLVPPLAVVGVAAAGGAWAASAGALLLFLANVIAIIVMSSLLFTLMGYARSDGDPAFRRRRAYLVVGAVGVVVVMGLAAITVRTVLVARWTAAAAERAEAWAGDGGDRILDVHFEGDELVVVVEGPDQTGEDETLLAELAGAVPQGTPVVIDRQVGSREEIGRVPR